MSACFRIDTDRDGDILNDAKRKPFHPEQLQAPGGVYKAPRSVSATDASRAPPMARIKRSLVEHARFLSTEQYGRFACEFAISG
jgi:hypothetical protein